MRSVVVGGDLGRSSGLQEEENLHPGCGRKRGSCFPLDLGAALLSRPKASPGVMGSGFLQL